MSQTVADVLVSVLEQTGVKQIFGLIGDSLNPIADALRRSNIEWVGVRHEEGAALAAAGQAKLTGQLAVCAGTTGPGSTHLVAGLYEASRDHAPVLALSGDMPRKMRGIDFFQTTQPDLLPVTSPSIRKQSNPQSRRRASFTRQSRRPMRAGASPI
jgi:pyruvate dehydrogenase (quinone)